MRRGGDDPLEYHEMMRGISAIIKLQNRKKYERQKAAYFKKRDELLAYAEKNRKILVGYPPKYKPGRILKYRFLDKIGP